LPGESGNVHGVGWSAKLRMVEQIESFGTELQVPRFAELEVFEDREINVVASRSAETAPSRVAEQVGKCLSRC
jgi:hypothetical protein